MAEEYLQHWGILGMHWGIRRYQNEDGTLTEAGKKRYASTSRKLESEKKKNGDNTPVTAQEVVSEVYDEQMRAEKTIFGASEKALKDASVLLPMGNGKTIKADFSNMTDEEIREAVNRLTMEKRLRELTGGEVYVKSGSEKARELLQTIGAAAGIGVSVVTIMQGVKAFQDGKNKG